MDWLFLALAIGCEIVATSALKAAQGFTRPGPTIAVLGGYACAGAVSLMRTGLHRMHSGL